LPQSIIQIGITQSNKVRGAALYDLSTTTSTAGVLPIANLPSGASANQLVTVSGSDNVLRAFDGQLLYGLNASALSSGTVPTARLGSGTASGSTYLKGDSTWATVTTGAPISQANTATVTPITFNYGTTINTVSKTINSGNTVVAIANGIVGFGNYPGESYLNLYANGTLIGATTVNCSATNEICPNYFITAVNTTLSGAVAFTLTGMRNTAAGKATGKIIVLDF